jgi:two-component system, NtrC family, sensor histidine kinase GlrK
MHMFRPTSIVQLILIGFAVVLALLIAAVVTAVVQVDRLAQESRDVVRTAEAATLQARLLVERLTEMERSLGRYHTLSDRHDYEGYIDSRRAFLTAAGALASLNLGEAAITQLQVLLENEQRVFENSRRHPASEIAPIALDPTIATWDELSRQARALREMSSTIISERAETALSRASSLQRALVLQAAMVIPTTIAIAAVFIILITRPMRRIRDSIRRLGANDLTSPITIQGPQDLEEVGEQLDWLRQRIRELEHQRMNFLRHISHELKTPLTAIREGAELLAEEDQALPKTAEDIELCQIIRDNSLHLQKLIEDLLQFGKTLDPVTTLRNLRDVDLTEVVQTVLSAHALSLTAKSINVRRELADVSTRADNDKVRIVVENLVANAIKFTPNDGEVTVSLRAVNGEAVLDVCDTGPGIAQEDRKLIFEPFYQGTGDYQAHVKGTGLGLAIAKEYVEAHHGRIEVLNSACGAHFRVRLPIAGPSEPPAA